MITPTIFAILIGFFIFGNLAYSAHIDKHNTKVMRQSDERRKDQ